MVWVRTKQTLGSKRGKRSNSGDPTFEMAYEKDAGVRSDYIHLQDLVNRTAFGLDVNVYCSFAKTDRSPKLST